jgi:hypothetical protein
VAGEGLLEFFEDVSLVDAAALAFLRGDGVAARDHLLVGVDADEGVAPDVLAAFDAFEEEGFGRFVGDAEEGGDGSLEVGGDGAVDRDQGVGFGDALEGGLIRSVHTTHWFGAHGR